VFLPDQQLHHRLQPAVLSNLLLMTVQKARGGRVDATRWGFPSPPAGSALRRVGALAAMIDSFWGGGGMPVEVLY
jgi:hypothetical protein